MDPGSDDGRTVSVTAGLVGVTVRTLHYWDEIGLASPSLRTPAGYRRYTETDRQRLHRIVAYREIGLGLESVREALDDPTTEVGVTLREQRARLGERIAELQRLDARLERMADAHEHGILLSAAEQAAIFGPGWDPGHGPAARARWGGSTQWAQFAERSAFRSRDEWRTLSEAVSAFHHDLAEAHDRGVPTASPEADALVGRHREVFSHFFPLSREMQVCLGRMYESDPDFSAYYEGIRAGLASWFRRIIEASARAHGIDPGTATWR